MFLTVPKVWDELLAEESSFKICNSALSELNMHISADQTLASDFLKDAFNGILSNVVIAQMRNENSTQHVNNSSNTNHNKDLELEIDSLSSVSGSNSADKMKLLLILN